MNEHRKRLVATTSSWSRVPGKHDVFCRDPGFLLAAEAACAAQGGRDRPIASAFTYILVKPDALVAAKAEAALRFVLRQGYDVVHATTVCLSEGQAIDIWRYQWNRATPERMKASLIIATAGPSILVALRPSSDRPGDVPASVALWASKGSAFAKLRSHDTLRSVLAVEGRYFGYVHVPDEPIDVVRELALLLGTGGFQSLLSKVAAARAAANAEEHAFRLLSEAREATAPDTYRFEEAPVVRDVSTALLDEWLARVGGATDRARRPVLSKADWARLHALSRVVEDNVEGVEPVVHSGDIGDPRVLWSR